MMKGSKRERERKKEKERERERKRVDNTKKMRMKCVESLPVIEGLFMSITLNGIFFDQKLHPLKKARCW